ncbi:hypothetical protein HZP84_12755 [Elizabethkingia anophelis]|uniref:Predicted integral membrane protein n=3 Tax=Elizabethkingia anophelis TaxID=1117645 RepID=X5KGG0_9FLAO|nr:MULTISPECIES: hypothetical protein [Elizabethkingia]AIL43815.1 hypothetical protein BD94_0040 [Elizabethkingia anophelis NUHP1]AKH96337.1 hypothetical protein M876_17435 [Elizabethkingia anophelis FMS-007]AMR42295.1 hypothetical protein A2T74_13480 [Elizabethkingia anophelis]AMX48935.1 hypothetical protein A4C56_13480 [Elizabethkingia anophelis]AMX52394.1 hypothetical protein A2T72_13480 [Elizabethkingia anophelis]
MSEFEEFDSSAKQPQRDFGDILSHAFNLYKGIIGYAIVVTLLIMAVSYFLSFLTGGWSQMVSMSQNSGYGYNAEAYKEMYTSGPVLWWAGSSTLFFILVSPIIIGIIYMMHKKNSGQVLDFSDLFIGFKQNTVNIMLYSLIYVIVATISTNLCYLPAVFIMPLFFLGYPILLFENAGAIEAISKSFNIVKENYGAFLLLNLVAFLLSGLGIIACCIGIIVSAFFYYATMYSAYVAYNGVPKQLTHTT